MNSNPTIKQVAQEAGVSVATVSRVMNGSADKIRISARTQQHVLRTVERLSYQPNMLARGLRSGRSRLIGIILRSVQHHSTGRLLQGVERTLSAGGYGLIVRTTEGVLSHMVDDVAFLADKQVEGMLLSAPLMPSRETGKQLRHLERSGARMVLMGATDIPGVESPYIGHDDIQVGMMATRHLLDLGHSNTLCLTCTGKHNTVGADRVQGYKAARLAAGLDGGLIREMNMQDRSYEEQGHRAMTAFLKEGRRCSAVFAHCDAAALGAMRAIVETGLRVPDDIALVGVDDEPFGRYITPSLTTVALDNVALGERAAAMLMQILEGHRVEPRKTLMKPMFIQRMSTQEGT